ncbi:hypothetical protein B0H14DRAFT_2354487, partial [Mycena olivaceomarginata]
LGGFFFKRGDPSCGNAKKLFPTVAYQLALCPELKRLILETMEREPAIVNRSLSTQLQRLIIDPCRRSCLSQPVSIIIDGLDEYNREDV